MTPERFPRGVIRKIEGTEFPLNVLEAVRDLRAYLDRVEAEALLKARELGASAPLMADALGVTRQGVYHKLKVLEEAKTDQPEKGSDEPIVIPDLEAKKE